MHKPLLAPLLASLLMTLAGASAQAQGVYRIVGPDGKVTFSDRPPADAPAQAARTTGAAPAAANGNATLPYELRQIATRFPVTIYTGNDCAPCTGLRNALVARGVPFTERTVTTSEDAAALQRLSGSASLPFGSIGGQQLVGFSDAEWTQYLDAAGYPKQSQLPANYQQPTATPLVAVKSAATAPAAEKPKAAAPVRPAPVARPIDGPTPSNPAGIRF
jgi:glutaredoxin